MPLLSKRRSVLDLLTPSSQPDAETNTTTSHLAPDRDAIPPRPRSEYGFPRSRLSHEVQPEDVHDPSETQSMGRAKRFSMLKFRNLSESHLAVRAKETERNTKENTPPVPAIPTDPLPSIVKTAPTMGLDEAYEEVDPEQEEEEEEKKSRPSFFRRSMSKGRSPSKRQPRKSTDEKRVEKNKSSSLRWRKLQGRSTGLEDLQRLVNAHINNNNAAAPPSYGDETTSALALPIGHRFSETNESEGSNGSDHIYGTTTTTTHTVSTHTTFFKLPRRNKNRNSLFPLPVKIPPPNDDQQRQLEEPTTPRASDAALSSKSVSAVPDNSTLSPPDTVLQRRHTETSPTKQQQSPLPTHLAYGKQSLSFASPAMNLSRQESQRSQASSGSSPLRPPMRLGMRDRASTNSSLGRSSYDMGTPPAFGGGSGRNSTSTQGRPSLGGLLNLSRFRQSSDPHSPRRGSPGTMSKSNSFAMSREALVVPEREEGDTPGKYLERLEAAVARSMIAGILSKSADPFAQAVLRSYTRRFPFFGEPIDMSLRKFLLEAELPKETQQVDRVIQAFADRYHECNPGIFNSPDQAYVIAFSLMMLHTDAFNKNNKRKMQKQDYIKNTSGQSVSDDVLGCFYDNICYTPFVHYEEEVDINGERVLPFKPKKSKLKGGITESGKKPSGPVDPYNLLVEQKLDQLRPPIRESISMEDPYNYRGEKTDLDPQYLQRAFTHTGVLQIMSLRSRPTAYEGQLTNGEPQNPMEVQPGIIDIKITKVGTLWRKATKKKKARSPWQEWGAILTGSQLYLFKNAHWAKGLVHQFTAAQKPGHPRTPVIFKPPLQEFKPDALVKTDNAVVLTDATYNRHKNAFIFVNAGGMEEVFLADNQSELNDWLALINYSAAFRAAGVRIRGMVGGTEEDLRARDVRRLESTQSARSTQTTDSTVSVKNRGLSPQLQRQVMAARRQIMVQKIGEANNEITEANQHLDNTLRNARHLLVLAPIAPKTREEIIHAAAHADASIKWTRRNIWREKCHRDILAMDVQQDGISASEVETLADQHIEAPEKMKKALARLNSKAGTARSPPLTPTSPTRMERPLTMSSVEDVMSNDVFKTPPESATEPSEEWRIPPLQLEILRQEREQRGSVTSTHLTASSHGPGSLSHASSTSSIRRIERLNTEDPTKSLSQNRSITPSASISDPEVEKLARTASPADRVESVASRAPNIDSSTAAANTSTPESNKNRHSGVRRSLQKTLREVPGGSHRHRRGKESDSTIRSGGTKDKDEEESLDGGTPGLKREKGRFILHGKQASVVQFGSDWSDQKRRELYRQNTVASSSSPQGSASANGGEVARGFSFSRNGWRADFAGAAGEPIVHDFTRDGEETDDEEGRLGSSSTVRSDGLRADAFAAEAFASRTESVSSEAVSDAQLPETDGEAASYYASATETENGAATDGRGEGGEAASYYSSAAEDQDQTPTQEKALERYDEENATTPMPDKSHHGAVVTTPSRLSSLQQNGNGDLKRHSSIRLVEKSDAENIGTDGSTDAGSEVEALKEKRRTVIGPSIAVNVNGESKLSDQVEADTSGGAAREGNHVEEA